MTDTAAPENTDNENEASAPTQTSQGIDYIGLFGPAFGPTFASMIPRLADVANEHNSLVAQLGIKEGEVSEEALEIARLQNKQGNEDVKRLNTNITKLQSKLSELMAQAYELVQDDVPQALKEDERTAVKARVSDLRKQFGEQTKALETVASATNVMDKLKSIELPSINANGRKVGGGGGKGYSGPRIRFDAVFIDGELAFTEKVVDGEKKITSNFTTAANKLTSITKANPRISSTDLQPLYFTATGVQPDSDGNLDSSKLPNETEFTYTYINPNDKSSRDFVIKAVRSES